MNHRKFDMHATWLLSWKFFLIVQHETRAHFTQKKITVEFKFDKKKKTKFAVSSFLAIILLQIVAHATIAQLSCQMHTLVAITLSKFQSKQNQTSREFELGWKNWIQMVNFSAPVTLNSNWSHSPKIHNLGQNWQYLVPCDLEIGWMTLENNRAPLLY